MSKISGIYCWSCKPTKQVYIGQSIDIHKRKQQHLYALRKQHHENYKLQNAFNTYSEKSFIFKILYKCPCDMLNHMEDYFIKKYNAIDDGFNIQNGSLRYSNKHHNIDNIQELNKLNKTEIFIREYICSKYDFKKEFNIEKIETIINEINFEFNENIDIYDFIDIANKLKLNIYLNFYFNPTDTTYNNQYEQYIKIEGDNISNLYTKDYKKLDNKIKAIIKEFDRFSLVVEFPQHKNKNNFIKKFKELTNKRDEALREWRDKGVKINLDLVHMATGFLENVSSETSLNEIQELIKERDKLQKEEEDILHKMKSIEKEFPNIENRYQYRTNGYVLSYIKDSNVCSYEDFITNTYPKILKKCNKT